MHELLFLVAVIVFVIVNIICVCCIGILIWRRILLLRLVQYAVEFAIAKPACVLMYPLKLVSLSSFFPPLSLPMK